MSLMDTEGQGIGEHIDRDAMRVRDTVAGMDTGQMRAFVIQLFRASGKSMDEIAEAQRCSPTTLRRDMGATVPDIGRVFRSPD